MVDGRARFEEIYDEYSGAVLGYALRRTSDPQDAADVVAETFAVAWRRMDDVPDGQQARLWLYGVARRMLANHHRGVRRHRRLVDRISGLTDVTSGQPPEVPELEAVAAAFQELSEADRELLSLVAWEGLDRDEIASILGCSRGTVRVRLHRARKRFERHLQRAGLKRNTASGHEPTRWATTRPDTEQA